MDKCFLICMSAILDASRFSILSFFHKHVHEPYAYPGNKVIGVIFVKFYKSQNTAPPQCSPFDKKGIEQLLSMYICIFLLEHNILTVSDEQVR